MKPFKWSKIQVTRFSVGGKKRRGQGRKKYEYKWSKISPNSVKINIKKRLVQENQKHL